MISSYDYRSGRHFSAEIYTFVATEFDLPIVKWPVSEDLPASVKPALAAWLWCIAVTTPLTQKAMHARGLLEEGWIFDDPNELLSVVEQMLENRASE